MNSRQRRDAKRLAPKPIFEDLAISVGELKLLLECDSIFEAEFIKYLEILDERAASNPARSQMGTHPK